MSTLNFHPDSSAYSFLPRLTQRVIERKTSVFQHKDGSTERSMTETVVMQNNEDLVAQLLAENNALKRQLVDAQADTAVSIDPDNWLWIALSIFFLLFREDVRILFSH